jgi:hypothetical protein
MVTQFSNVGKASCRAGGMPRPGCRCRFRQAGFQAFGCNLLLLYQDADQRAEWVRSGAR